LSWLLIRACQDQGSPAKDGWALLALGHSGGDATAVRLAELLRTWPAEGQHRRAALGLECLRTVGTDTALAQLAAIAQKGKHQTLRKKARELMNALAQGK